MSTESHPQNALSDALKAYGAYPFDTDENYQQGLASILSGGTYDTSSSQEVRDEMIRRTRVFYFNKITGNSITFEQVRDYEFSSEQPAGAGSDAATATDDETRVLTFAELKELIESGNVDKIPNNKIIPDRLNDAPPSQSNAPLPKKPWETATNSS